MIESLWHRLSLPRLPERPLRPQPGGSLREILSAAVKALTAVRRSVSVFHSAESRWVPAPPAKSAPAPAAFPLLRAQILKHRKAAVASAAVAFVLGVSGGGCALFQSEQVAKGQKLYTHYCMHCHGENGRQNEGFNWAHMPDPRPKDLSSKEEMSTFKDEEIYNTISRDMKDTTPEVGDTIGDDEFAVPTMPTFKFTLSEEELWSLVAYVRTLHGTKLQYNLEGRKKELQDRLQSVQQKFDQAKQVLEAAEKKVTEEAEKAGKDPDDEATAKEQDALTQAAKELEQAKTALANFSSRPKAPLVPRPELASSPQESAKLAAVGQRLYTNKFGCNACHRIGEEGGVVGPPLDRAGFRLNPTWVYRWAKYPQSMKPETKMPNLGLSDQEAKAVARYLSTLRSPRPDSKS